MESWLSWGTSVVTRVSEKSFLIRIDKISRTIRLITWLLDDVRLSLERRGGLLHPCIYETCIPTTATRSGGEAMITLESAWDGRWCCSIHCPQYLEYVRVLEGFIEGFITWANLINDFHFSNELTSSFAMASPVWVLFIIYTFFSFTCERNLVSHNNINQRLLHLETLVDVRSHNCQRRIWEIFWCPHVVCEMYFGFDCLKRSGHFRDCL